MSAIVVSETKSIRTVESVLKYEAIGDEMNKGKNEKTCEKLVNHPIEYM